VGIARRVKLRPGGRAYTTLRLGCTKKIRSGTWLEAPKKGHCLRRAGDILVAA
jgi:hypothetical protein